MKEVEVDFKYNIPEWGTVTLVVEENLDNDAIELEALKNIKDIYGEITDVEIEGVREIKDGD